ncbi:MAG: hypothetical protein J6X89_06470 [Bacteroidales bacterium]|nr:hypothetical protein [Bacteroidales bacterium]
MKRIILTIMAACALLVTSCVDYESQIEETQKKIEQLIVNREDLATITNSLGGLRDVLLIKQSGDPIVSVTKTETGYDFKFMSNGTVSVPNQTAAISVGVQDGNYFWTLNGTPLTDASGKNATIATAPEFRVSEDAIEVSTDGQKTWQQISKSDKPVVQSINEDGSNIAVTFLGGTVVDFAKDATIAVMISGDGSTMATKGTAVIDFLIDGEANSYTVIPVLPDHWGYQIIWENETKGQVVVTALEPAAGKSAQLLFGDGLGHTVTCAINFDTLKVDEKFPVMYPAWDAYSALWSGSQVDIKLYINLDKYDVTIEPGADWLTMGGTKAVREETVTLTAQPNNGEAMRSAKVVISSDTYTQTVMVWQEPRPVDSGENLSANGTANCYIITKAGDYYFDATVAGCGDSGIMPSTAAPYTDFPASSVLEPVRVEIVYNTGDVISGTPTLKDGKVYFHATDVEGNALIAIKNSRGITAWSWHIWRTDAPQERTHTNPDLLRFTTLDRNLGATSADPADGTATHGVYYQWGRKDPFEANTAMNSMANNSSHAFAFSIRYPQRPYTADGNSDGNWYSTANVYLWGNPDYGKNRHLKDLSKSIYDPCPVGYMVPPANAFLIFRDETRTQYTEEGMIVRGDYGQESFYPFAGRMYRGGTVGRELALWHSCAGRYGVNESAGAAVTVVDKETHTVYWYQGDMRARAIPVRCVKQVAE